MAFLDWDDSLSVNVTEIDDQHKKLIGTLNDLYDAMDDGKGNDVLGKILKELTDYTVYHFQTEENYFKKFNSNSIIKGPVSFAEVVAVIYFRDLNDLETCREIYKRAIENSKKPLPYLQIEYEERASNYESTRLQLETLFESLLFD